MELIYGAVVGQASAQGKLFAATGWFMAGYLLTVTFNQEGLYGYKCRPHLTRPALRPELVGDAGTATA